jgi:23S rRNA (adenine2030-N6)-methyltransferase
MVGAIMSDYDHRYHAGNHGDVWKHVGWLALLAAYKRDQITIVDTHAGRGGYDLADRGEWMGGIGPLWGHRPKGTSSGSGAVDRYVAKVPRRMWYPGSPMLAAASLRRGDRLIAYEQDVGAAAALRAALSDKPHCRVVVGDGWAAPELAAKDPCVVLIDPPFVEKEDWGRAVDVLGVSWRAGHHVLLWYPVKRWSRPNLLLQRLREASVPYVAIDFLVTPIDLAKDRLAGSGLVLVNVPDSVAIELHAAAPVLGPLLAGEAGRWGLRTTANGG